MTNSSNLMMKLHADCILLERILDKKVRTHLKNLGDIEFVKGCVRGGDLELVKRYEEKLIEMRSAVN